MDGLLDPELASSERQQARIARHMRIAETLAHWADRRWLDPLLGLAVPWLGDALGAAIGLHTVGLAVMQKAPKVLIARMLLNLAIDAGVGLIPVLGDIFDFTFRAHSKNLSLLRRRATPGETDRSNASDWLWVAGAALLFAAAVTLPVWLSAAVLALLL